MEITEKMSLFRDNPVVSWHEHLWANADFSEIPESKVESLLKNMDILGFDKCVVSLPLANDKYCPPEEFKRANELIYNAIKNHSDRLYGQAFVNPGFAEEAVAEVEHCVKDYGFVGVKLYHQYYMDDPAQHPLIKKCIELNIPILIHAGHPTDPNTKMRQPRISGGDHMANAARKFPEATFLMGHIGGGGDWQWQIKAIADCPNVYADIGGSIYDRPLIEESYRYLGAERLIFATDGPFSCSVGKILGADIPVEAKKTIMASRGFEKFLRKAGK